MYIDAERLRHFMEAERLNQIQMAALLGIGQSDLSDMLNKKRGAGMKVAGRILLALPVHMWAEVLRFEDGRSVFAEYERLKAAEPASVA